MVQQGLIHVRRREIWHFLKVFGVCKYLILLCTTNGKGQMNFEPRRKWSLVVQLFITSGLYILRIFTSPYWLTPLCLFGFFFFPVLEWISTAQARQRWCQEDKAEQSQRFLSLKNKNKLMQLLKGFSFSNVSDIWNCWIQARYTRTTTDLFNRVCK